MCVCECVCVSVCACTSTMVRGFLIAKGIIYGYHANHIIAKSQRKLTELYNTAGFLVTILKQSGALAS